MNSIYSLMTLNRVKLRRAVTSMKYLASAVSLNFNLEFRLSNLLNLAELVVNGLTKSIIKKIYQYSFFYPIYHWLL